MLKYFREAPKNIFNEHLTHEYFNVQNLLVENSMYVDQQKNSVSIQWFLLIKTGLIKFDFKISSWVSKPDLLKPHSYNAITLCNP